MFSKDPLKYCSLYKDKGCCHVDGFLCNVKTCVELKEYEEELEWLKRKTK